MRAVDGFGGDGGGRLRNVLSVLWAVVRRVQFGSCGGGRHCVRVPVGAVWLSAQKGQNRWAVGKRRANKEKEEEMTNGRTVEFV